MGRMKRHLISTLIFLSMLSSVSSAEPVYEVTYDRFRAPLFHGSPFGEKISLHVAKISLKEKLTGVPTILLNGGPGNSAANIARRYQQSNTFPAYFEPFLQNGPLYLLDQRGTGASGPKWACPENPNLDVMRKGTRSAYIERAIINADWCKSKFQNFNHVANALTVTESIHDIESLRRHIRTEKINLLAVSFGTQLGLAYMKKYPNHVEKAALLLVLGTGQTYGLPHNFDNAIRALDVQRKSMGKSRLYPALEKFGEDLEKRLEPITITLPETGETVQFNLSDYEYQSFLIKSMRKGFDDKLARAIEKNNYISPAKAAYRWRKNTRFNLVRAAMRCSSGMSFKRMVQIERQRKTSLVGHACRE